MAVATLGSRQELLDRMNSMFWVHAIDVGGGVTTPGHWGKESQVHIREALDDVDFRGKKVLDIGCWDGLWSFEAEKRGASEVYATDDIRQRDHAHQPTFQLAAELLGSRVRYVPDVPVNDVGKLGVRDFDVVIFNGIFYHLRDPLLAFTRLRRVMKDGGILIAEGEVKYDEGCYAEYHYEKYYARSASNWWVPTVECLQQWVKSTYFDIVKEYPRDPRAGTPEPARRNGLSSLLKKPEPQPAQAPRPYGRYIIAARAVRKHDPHYWGVDDELDEFQTQG